MRALAWFWAVLIAVAVVGGGFLQWHGPPIRAVATTALPSAAAPHDGTPEAASASPTTVDGGRVAAPAATIAPPDPALLEPSKDFAGGFLPIVGADHRQSAQAYAAAPGSPPQGPAVAVLLAGIGMSAADSDQAIIAAPPAISLAISPYTVQPAALLAEARAHGHEYFVSIPMEPRAYPLDDPGSHALLTGNSQSANEQQLAWALTRFGGYVGATGALGALHGERFADSPSQIGPVLDELSRRGLLYVDPRPGAALPPGLAGRDVDVVIDQTPGATEIDANLARLEASARLRGSALGLVSVPRPVATARLVAWAAGLAARGFVLLPVSAVVHMPLHAQQAGP